MAALPVRLVVRLLPALIAALAAATPASASSAAGTGAHVKKLERQVRTLQRLVGTLQRQTSRARVVAAPADLGSGGVFDGNLEVTGQLRAAANSGVAFNADGNLDGKGGSDPNPYRVGLGVQAVNGSNGPRGNSILTDTANGAGASFFAPFYLNSDFRTTGSLTGYTAYLNVDETPQGGQYGEAMPFYGGVVTSRAGALTSGAELQNTVAAGSPARATGANVIVKENNPLSAYADRLPGTAWADTGSRALDVISAGSQPVGVGVMLRGGFNRAIALQAGGGVPFTVTGDGQVVLANPTAAAAVLRTLVAGDGTPRFSVLADGRLVWGNGLTLQRSGAKTLRTNGRLFAAHGLGVGNSRRAHRTGRLVRKMQVFDRRGHSLGYVPIYR